MDRITVDGALVCLMYREEPQNDLDSGWRYGYGLTAYFLQSQKRAFVRGRAGARDALRGRQPFCAPSATPIRLTPRRSSSFPLAPEGFVF